MQPAAAAIAFFFLSTFGFTLNPDGSGKVAIEITASRQMWSSTTSGPIPVADVKKFGQWAVRQAEGIETWSNVSFGTTPEGRLSFNGTGYFASMDKLNFRGLERPFPLTWKKDEKGGGVMEVVIVPPGYSGPLLPRDLTDEQLTERIKTFRALWQHHSPQSDGRLGNTMQRYTFKLPGAVAETNGLKKAADGSAVFEYDGARIIKAATELAEDEAYLRNTLKAGMVPCNDPRDTVMQEKIFGAKAPITARVAGPMKPQFDYQAEVKAAKEAWPKMAETLGLAAEPAAVK
jgi:hypothetical protein